MCMLLPDERFQALQNTHYCVTLHYVMVSCTVLHCVVSLYSMLHHVILCSVALYCVMLYHAIFITFQGLASVTVTLVTPATHTTPAAALKRIATQISDRITACTRRHSNTIVAAYQINGETAYKYMGNVSSAGL